MSCVWCNIPFCLRWTKDRQMDKKIEQHWRFLNWHVHMASCSERPGFGSDGWCASVHWAKNLAHFKEVEDLLFKPQILQHWSQRLWDVAGVLQTICCCPLQIDIVIMNTILDHTERFQCVRNHEKPSSVPLWPRMQRQSLKLMRLRQRFTARPPQRTARHKLLQ